MQLKNIRIVLVEPSHPGNIGGAARAMKTMGLSSLYVVSPRRFPDPQADWRAAGALDVLDQARVVDTLDQALEGVQWMVGTSTRNRKIPWPITDAKGVAEQAMQLPDETQSAILFGREDNGLTNDELSRCHLHLQIPAAPEYSSLNLAMAVQVVCYEIYQRFVNAVEDEFADTMHGWDRRIAKVHEIDALLAHFEEVLTGTAFLSADNPGQTLTRLRRMFARIRPDETEVQILRGVLKHLAGAQPLGSVSNDK
ncbi:MAG: RNA methyltransferase [Pseudomonadota bacterium]